MVAGETRNARAISSTARPQSVLSVKATCASRASAGWQQVKISLSRSSTNGSSTRPGGGAAASVREAISALLAARVFARRSRSIALWRAVETSQARGLAGTPPAAHCSRATAKASCSASSARSKSRRRRMSVARARARSSR